MTVQTDWPELACLDSSYRVDLVFNDGTEDKSISCDCAEQVNTLVSYASSKSEITNAYVWTLAHKHTWPSVDIQVDCVEGAVLELNELPRGC